MHKTKESNEISMINSKNNIQLKYHEMKSYLNIRNAAYDSTFLQLILKLSRDINVDKFPYALFLEPITKDKNELFRYSSTNYLIIEIQ